MKASAWKTCRLGDVVTLKRGYDLPETARSPGEFPVVSSAGVTDYHAEPKVAGPGVITGRYGTLGRVFYVKSDFWPLNTSLYVHDFKGNDPRFISYLLSSLDLGQQNAAGAVPGVNRNHLHALTVRIPSLKAQRSIAGVLAAYDDLIENSQQRIRVLEAIIRTTYREWFVELRFPGSENLSTVASPLGEIPHGWTVRKLGDVLKLNYGKALKKEDRRDGTVPVYGSSGVVGTHDSSLVEGPGVVVGRKGNVGSVFWCDEKFFVIDTAYFVTSSLPLRYLFHVLPTLNFINSDTAVPGLSRDQAYSLDMLVPPTPVIAGFCEIADHLDGQAAILRRQIQNIRRTHDLLLPRLLSGRLNLDSV